MVAILANRRDVRPKDIEEGEGGLYTTTGWKVFCDTDGNVHPTGKDPPRADRVDAVLNKLHTAIDAGLAAVPEAGLDGGLAAFTAMSQALQRDPQTKRDKVKGK